MKNLLVDIEWFAHFTVFPLKKMLYNCKKDMDISVVFWSILISFIINGNVGVCFKPNHRPEHTTDMLLIIQLCIVDQATMFSDG